MLLHVCLILNIFLLKQESVVKMPIQLQVRGLNELNKFFVRLGPNLNKEIPKVMNLFMKETQKSARIRAPKFTGQLSRSIRVFKKGNKTIILRVDSPYGYFQEFGFTPKFLPADLPVEGGYRITDWMQSKGITGRGIKPSGKPQPFILPALELNLSRLPNLLSQGAKNAIQKSKGR